MKHENNITYFEKGILKFYREEGRKHLPWRNKNMTPYKVWVSEIMLQQTQVDRVVDFYRKFLKRFPSASSLAKASWDEFLPYYQGLGYYNRGRNMLRTAQIIRHSYGGKFPKDKNQLMLLPGIGEYTASAILSFSHNHDHLAWDTNFYRVFGRFFYGSKDAEVEKEKFEKSIKADKRDFNGAIMDFGSILCVKDPKCTECSLAQYCTYLKQKGKQEQIRKKSTASFPTRNASAYIFLHKNHKVYYSRNKKKYTPFNVPATYNSRDGVKKYFQERYGLQLSVRPPHKKLYIQKKPVLLINAQILSGKQEFFTFTKQEVNATMSK